MKELIHYANKYYSVSSPQHRKLVDIYSGNLVEYVKAELAKELSTESFKVASERIPSINLLQRIVNKLSNVYSQVPKRTTTSNTDQELINAYIPELDIDKAMSNAELLLNANKQCAIEPYFNSETNTLELRVLAAHEFCIYSDNAINPLKPTHFIKFMGLTNKGKKKTNLYHVYTATEFIEVDSDGDIITAEVNPLGVIPFVYISQDAFNLQPSPDIDTYKNSTLIPRLLSDLNYATQYQSHSIMYGIDIDAKGLQGNPDSFWSISSAEGENKKPQIGVLSPSVDVDKVLSLITFTVSEWLSCKGIKAGSIGSLDTANAASGISKLVDEADTTQVHNKNKILLINAEKKLWTLIGMLHNAYSGLLNANRNFSSPLIVSITFDETQNIIKDPSERRAELEFQLKNKLISYSRALKEAHPNLSDDEIEKLKQEILDEQNQTNFNNGELNNGQATR